MSGLGPAVLTGLLPATLVPWLQGQVRLTALLVSGDVIPGRCWISLLGPRCQGSQQVLSEGLHFCFQFLTWGDEGFEDLSVVGAKHLLIVLCQVDELLAQFCQLRLNESEASGKV